MTDRKIYKHRPMRGLKSSPDPVWHDLNAGARILLSDILSWSGFTDRIHVCGPLEKMTREWMMEPLAHGWKLGREFVFKHRTAVYRRPEKPDEEFSVKLISHRESWLPGCDDAKTACDAWDALKAEWQSTGLPLLSSPAATGKALLWESFPRDAEFPSLPDDLAKLIRSTSPQHRIEKLTRVEFDDAEAANKLIDKYCIQYDGRWMYAAMCGLDRFPVGEPKRVGYFQPYEPGWHLVQVKIPSGWDHIGLLPMLTPNGWTYPNRAGLFIRGWAAEPELTLALKCGWEIVEHYDGYTFEKGRPLGPWSRKLIEMRAELQEKAKWAKDGPGPFVTNHYDYAAAAIRQILNHTIGAIHRNDFEREMFVSDDNFRQWRRENPDLAESTGGHRDPVRVEGGYLVPCFVPDTSRLSIFMPHLSATIYSLARARVAEWCLKCDPSTLVKINGDALYSTIEQPELDALNTGRLGQPRRK